MDIATYIRKAGHSRQFVNSLGLGSKLDHNLIANLVKFCCLDLAVLHCHSFVGLLLI